MCTYEADAAMPMMPMMMMAMVMLKDGHHSTRSTETSCLAKPLLPSKLPPPKSLLLTKQTTNSYFSIAKNLPVKIPTPPVAQLEKTQEKPAWKPAKPSQ
jgi:hypothetical protein